MTKWRRLLPLHALLCAAARALAGGAAWPRAGGGMAQRVPAVGSHHRGRRPHTDRRTFHRDAHTFLVYPFGQGLEDNRCVVEKYRFHPGDGIEPMQAKQPGTNGRRRQRHTTASLAAFRPMRAGRDKIMVCTALSLKDFIVRST